MKKRTKIAFSGAIILICVLNTGCFWKKEDPAAASDTAIAQMESAEIPSEESQEQETTDGGGNEYESTTEAQIIELNVLVDGETYIFNNAPISLEQLKDSILKRDKNVSVIISDHNATRNAYKKLISLAEELEIKYVER